MALPNNTNEKLRILLCEDDENLGMLLREYVQAKGFICDLYSDGDAGFKAFLKGRYDFCILDVMMPKKDGDSSFSSVSTMMQSCMAISASSSA